jgi:hypothetical protein
MLGHTPPLTVICCTTFLPLYVSSLLFSDISNNLNFANMQLRVYSVCDNSGYHDPTPSCCAPRSNLTRCTDVSRTTLECFVAHMQIFWEETSITEATKFTSASCPQTFQAVTHSTESIPHDLVALCMHEIRLKSKHVQVLDRSIIHSVRHHSVLLKFSHWLTRTSVQWEVQPLQDTSQNIRRATSLSHWQFFSIIS